MVITLEDRIISELSNYINDMEVKAKKIADSYNVSPPKWVCIPFDCEGVIDRAIYDVEKGRITHVEYIVNTGVNRQETRTLLL